MPRNRTLELLAVQRLGFLKPGEKLRLMEALDAGSSLERLTLSGLERRVGRVLRRARWEPARLIAEAESDLGLLERLGARFVELGSASYPAALAEIADPPFGLYALGRDLPADRPALALVGTREASGLGLECARGLAAAAAEAGIPVVSGLARGIDGAAHRGALEGARRAARRAAPPPRDCEAAQLPAAPSHQPAAPAPAPHPGAAVLPCGLDAVYPPSHRGLAKALLEAGGLLLSEYPPGQAILRYRFPERNRIIAGLARGLLVVEAPEGSGALISAEYALEEGRDIFVASACLGGPRSGGIERLAAEGARAVASCDEILASWGLAGGNPARGAGSGVRAPTAQPGLFDDISDCREAGRESASDARGWTSESEGARLAAALRAELGLRIVRAGATTRGVA